MHKEDHSGLVRGESPGPDIITQDQMRNLIRAEADAVGGINQLCRNLHMGSAAPVYLALQEQRPISDGISLSFGFERITMFRRIGHASRKA